MPVRQAPRTNRKTPGVKVSPPLQRTSRAAKADPIARLMMEEMSLGSRDIESPEGVLRPSFNEWEVLSDGEECMEGVKDLPKAENLDLFLSAAKASAPAADIN